MMQKRQKNSDYGDYFVPLTKVSLSALRKMATTKEQEDILKRIEDETISSVRDAWIDHFLKITKRSQCKSD